MTTNTRAGPALPHNANPATDSPCGVNVNRIDPTSVTGYLASLDPMRTTGLIIGLFVGLAALYLLLHYSTRKGRARARAAALAWADARAVEWRALAEARADRIRARATGEGSRARVARLALMAGGTMVALVGIAGTNLSAHGIQARLGEVGLGNIDARISVFIVFEGVLILAGGLSFWHQVTGRAGVDRYALGMWGMSLFMAYLAAWGGGSPVYAPFPIIAAVAFHELTAAEAKRRGKYRGILGRGATSQDATAVDTERRINAIVTYGTRANVAVKGTRWFWAILHGHAERAADARGILTPAVRAVILERSAARYVGARALAPDEVAAHNPWNAAHALAAAPITVPEDARDLLQVARERALILDGARAVEAAPVAPEAPAPPAPAPAVEAPRAPLHLVADGDLDEAAADALIAEHCIDREDVREFVREFWGRTRRWPTGRQLAEHFGGDAGNCRKWVSDLKKATAGRVAA